MKIFDRIIDRQGEYYQIGDIPTGDEFCRIMGVIGKDPGAKMFDVIPTIYYKTVDSGFLGKINKFMYDETHEKYKLYFDNCDGYDSSATYYLYISMRIFEIDTIENIDGVYTLDILDEEFYGLMRDAENKNMFPTLDDGYKEVHATVWASGQNGMPEIEYSCNWDNRQQKEIPTKEFYRLSNKTGTRRKRTTWRGLKYTTGIKTAAGNNKYIIKSHLGIAMTENSGSSKFSPSCLEISMNDGTNSYIIRMHYSFFGLDLSGLPRYGTNEMQTWMTSTLVVGYNTIYNYWLPDNYASGGSTKYYDGDDFNSSSPSDFKTPKKLYIFRTVAEISENIYFTRGLEDIDLIKYIIRDYQSTGNVQDAKVIGDSAADQVDIIESGTAFRINDDGVSLTLKNAIAAKAFAKGDLFINDDTGELALITILSVSYIIVTGVGSFAIATDLENWRITHTYDQIMKIGSYACSSKRLASLISNCAYDFNGLHYIRVVEMGYYGRNNQIGQESGQREIFQSDDLDVNIGMYIPGNKGTMILKTYEDEGDTNLGINVDPVDRNIKFHMKDVVAYEGQETFTNKDELVWFFIQGTKKYPYMSHIDIISKYIEELELLGEDDVDRKIWVEDTEDGYDLYYKTKKTFITSDINKDSTVIALSDYVGVPDTSGDYIYIVINGERFKCTKSGSVITIDTRTTMKKHYTNDVVYYIGVLLYPKILMGYISSTDPLDFLEDGTFKVDAVNDPIDLTGSREKMLVIGSGVDSEIEMINVLENNVGLDNTEYTIILDAADREQRGTVAKEFPVGTEVFLMDYMSTLEVLRARDSNVEYNGKYNATISLNASSIEEIDLGGSNRVYIVRVKWKI